MKPVKQKKCRVCKKLFTPFATTAKVCSLECAVQLSKKDREKAKKIERLNFRKRVLENDKAHQTKLAQKAFNLYIRNRDAADPCISCQRHHTGQYHAGHYRTTASAPQHRFNESACHKQCSVCNNHLSGNIADYRINLIKKIGLEAVEKIENDNEYKKLTIEQIIAIKEKYQKLNNKWREK